MSGVVRGGAGPRPGDAVLTVALCFLGAAFEGIDVQAMGVAASKLIPQFHLTAAQFGTAASMSLGGLLVGAVIGGRLADRYGRRLVLVWSLALLGLFSLLTASVRGYDQLLVIRFLVGLGLGGAFPVLIALVSENASPRWRTMPISLMYAGLPLGTVILTLLVLAWGPAFQWRWIFYLGGVGPLLVAPLMYAILPESPGFRRVAAGVPAAAAPVGEVLFGARRMVPTVLLWLAFFFTLTVIYLLTNWLSPLMTGRGLSHAQAIRVLLGFGCGSIVGSIALGAVTDSGYRRYTALITYTGVAICLAGIALLTDPGWLIAASAGTGFFAVGAQLVNYALAPEIYPVRMRGTGVGWTVAVGRLGSFAGPLLGGLLLGAGLTESHVLLLFIPGLIVAAIASSLMLWRPTPVDATEAAGASGPVMDGARNAA